MFRLKIVMVSVILGVAMVMAQTNLVWAKGEKVTLCHIDRETGVMETIRVGVGAVAAHLNHGDVVIDVCPGEEEKVEICHHAPPESDNMFTLLVDAEEVAEHVSHGDETVACEDILG